MSDGLGIKLNDYIDHTLLKPEASQEQILQLCQEAIDFRFKGVCINSSMIPLAKKALANQSPLLVAVVGFPLGACLSEAKASETQLAITAGAQEIDMVIHVGALKEGRYEYVQQDIQDVVRAAGSVPVKVILETGLLTPEEIVKACELSQAAGAAFVKTCTGFNVGSANVTDVQMMRETVGPEMGVKASGGIKTYQQALDLIRAGATRLGTSSGVALVTGQKAGGGY